MKRRTRVKGFDAAVKFLGVMLAGLICTSGILASELPKTEAEQAKFMENGLKASPAWESWEMAFGQAKMFGGKKPHVDAEAITKVHKLAVISFDTSLYAKKSAGMGSSGSLMRLATMAVTESKQRQGIKPEDLIQFNNAIYDDLSSKLTAQGFEVISPEKITSNEAYQKIEGEKKDAALNSAWSMSSGIKATASAKDLKSLPALDFIKPGLVPLKDKMTERATVLQDLAKSLGVDGVVIVSNSLYMEIGSFSGKYEMLYANNDKGPNGISIDVFAASEPKLIWSVALVDALEVPTQSEQEGASHLLGVIKYEFGDKAMTDFIGAYQVMDDMFARKIKSDSTKTP